MERSFIKDLFYSAEINLGRVFVQEGVLANDNEVTILDYERVTYMIEEAEHIAVWMYYCRHKITNFRSIKLNYIYLLKIIKYYK